MAGGRGHGKKDDHHAPTPDPKGSKGGSKGPKQGVWGEMLGKMSGWIGALALIIPTAITARFAALGNDNARDAFTGFAGEWFEDKSEKLIKNPGPWLKKHLPKIKPFFKDEAVNAALSELAGFLVKEGAGKHKGAYFFGEILTRGLKGVGEGLSEEAEIEALTAGLTADGTFAVDTKDGTGPCFYIKGRRSRYAHFSLHCENLIDDIEQIEQPKERTAMVGTTLGKGRDAIPAITTDTQEVKGEPANLVKGASIEEARLAKKSSGFCPDCTPEKYLRRPDGTLAAPPEPEPKEDHADHHDEPKGFAAKVKAVVGGFRDVAGVVVDTINPNPHRLEEIAKLKGKRANNKLEINRIADELRKQDPNHPLLAQLNATPASK